jgi:hypothetical protein
VSRILHLLVHDLRTQRGLLLAWVVIVVAHPVMAWLPWSQSPSGVLLAPPVLLVAARLIIGSVALGSLIQQDSPIDDRAFWRTRPIRTGEMAAAKLTLAVVVFVLLPLAVVIAVAMAAGVPWSHWPSMVGQVVFTDAALVGLVMAAATRTQRVSTLLIAVVATVLGAYLLLIATTELRRSPGMAPWASGSSIDPEVALPTILIWVSLGLWALTALGFAGHRRRMACALLAVATVAAMLVTWHVPQARLHQRANGPDGAEVRLTARVDGTRLRAVRMPHREHLIGIVAQPIVSGTRPGDRTRAFLLDGQLTGPGLDRPARRGTEPRSIPGGAEGLQMPLLGVFTPEEFARLAGKPVRFAGRLNLDVSRPTAVASGALAPGTQLVGEGSRLGIDRILEVSEGFRQPVADTYLMQTYVPGRWRARPYEYRLRDVRSGCQATLLLQSSPRAEIASIALLPTLARPFSYGATGLLVLDNGGCRPGRSSSVVEAYHLRTLLHAVPVTVDFTMPSVLESVSEPPPRG